MWFIQITHLSYKQVSKTLRFEYIKLTTTNFNIGMQKSKNLLIDSNYNTVFSWLSILKESTLISLNKFTSLIFSPQNGENWDEFCWEHPFESTNEMYQLLNKILVIKETTLFWCKFNKLLTLKIVNAKR